MLAGKTDHLFLTKASRRKNLAVMAQFLGRETIR